MLRQDARPGKGLLAGLLILILAASAAAQVPGGGVQVIQHGGYSELHVDGAPFFVHSAVFFYYRIPRDLWGSSLDRYHALGINTIDLPLPWNWHEPREGEFDFDGHTNSRRDLRGLLQHIAEKGFKLIVRPGPIVGNQWRHGGYPEWLLTRPEYKMDAADRLAGLPPPIAVENTRDAEAAAKAWLENATHMAYVANWLAAVGREMAPYGSRRKLRVTVPSEETGEPKEKEISGPLLFVVLDDSPAIGTPHPGAMVQGSFPRYMEALRRMLEAGGVEAQCVVSARDLVESGAGTRVSGLSERAMGLTGQWFLPAQPPGQGEAASDQRKLTAKDASELAFLAETLQTQPGFPAMLSGYQAGWYAPGDDVRPPESHAANTLLGSRLLLAHGLHGLDYFPLQDTLTPAGYETPEANRYYRWDAALDLAGNRQPRARGVARNGALLETWGPLLAASHKRADFGLVDPRGALAGPQKGLGREDILQIGRTLMQVERVAQLASLADELLDPESQPVETLLRNAVVLLPVFDPPQEKFQLSEKAQGVLVEYVRRGGTLVYFPTRPAGNVLEQLWRSTPGKVEQNNAPGQEVAASWKFGEGRVVELSKDFYSWVALDESFAENRTRFEAAWAIQSLRGLLEQAGVQPAVKGSGDRLVVTQLVANEGTDALGKRRADCAGMTLCGQGLLSVTNLSFDEPVEETLDVLSPRASAQGKGEEPIRLGLLVPARESLLLPLHYPLCSAASDQTCADEVVAAGAELLRAEREGKVLELTFCNPSRATILLKLESIPAKIMLAEMNLEAQWLPDTHLLELSLPRGASPDFLRVLKLRLRYTPHVPAKPDPHKRARRDFTASVADAAPLPLGEDTSLPSDPPLVLLDQEHNGQMLLRADNYDELGREVSIRSEGPIHAGGRLMLGPKEVHFRKIAVNPARESAASGGATTDALSDGLLRGELKLHSGHIDRSFPIVYAAVGEKAPSHYQFDFDRDGAKEWVLENQSLRVILSPEDGGRAIALVEKAFGTNLTTTVGALRDLFFFRGNSTEASREVDLTFNQAYRAEWLSESNSAENSPAVRLSYQVPDSSGGPNNLGGARIEKTVRLAGIDSVEVDYRVARPASHAAADAPWFMAMNSVPARASRDLGTSFCWQEPAAAPSQGSPPPEEKEGAAAARHCEGFVPGRESLTVPEGITRLEVRTPGRAGLALEWPAGRMTIEMKRFSALLKLHFPPPGPGGASDPYRVRYTVLPAE